jgi:hypothetical protein
LAVHAANVKVSMDPAAEHSKDENVALRKEISFAEIDIGLEVLDAEIAVQLIFVGSIILLCRLGALARTLTT